MPTTPRFKHDCVVPGCCRFVGRTLRFDVYTYNHAAEGREIGIIMRSGDDGPDYSSYPAMRYALMVSSSDAEVYHAVQMVNALQSG